MGAGPVTPAVALGRFCVTHNIPVKLIAGRVGVTRTTVYSWFTGERQPRAGRLAELTELLAALEARV